LEGKGGKKKVLSCSTGGGKGGGDASWGITKREGGGEGGERGRKRVSISSEREGNRRGRPKKMYLAYSPKGEGGGGMSHIGVGREKKGGD